MQNLPVILSVFAAAAAIVAVLLWRLKPQPAGDVEALNRRVSEEADKARMLQTKLDEMQDTWRVAEANAAAARATAEAANENAGRADRREKDAVLGLAHWQGKYGDVEPLLATANAQKVAAEAAQAESVRLHDDLATRHNGLQTEFNGFKPAVAKAVAEKDAAERARAVLEKSLQELTREHKEMLAGNALALDQASTLRADEVNLHTQIGGMARTIETLELNLAEDRAKLNAALATQQSSEDAVRQFETISQAILKDVIGEAKREVGELAATIQKTSGEELSKHADKVARTLEPLQSKLEAYDKSIKSMEEVSHKTFGGLTSQISELQRAEQSLHTQAKALTAALSDSPKMRGNYGELTLKRLVEHAGMEERCHFEAQASRDTEDGRKIPDMVFSLPGGQKVVVDAKAILNACTEAYEVEEEAQRKILLKKHCENVRSRVSELSAKNYFVNHSDSVESVLLFLPAENLYIAAMMTDPGLTDYAAARKVTICGPNSLMLLLRVANQLWSRASIEKEAHDIKKCGEDIYNAACNFVEKFSGIGKKIGDLEAEYNGAMATFESRLLPAGKRMSTFEAVARNKEIGELMPVKDNVRDFRETTKRLVPPTLRLPELVIGDETGELVFAAGGNQ